MTVIRRTKCHDIRILIIRGDQNGAHISDGSARSYEFIADAVCGDRHHAFLFVTTTVGMLLTTMIFEFLYAYGRGDTEKFGQLTLFFSRIFFFSFGTGVVTGLIMEFSLADKWSAFTRLMAMSLGLVGD